MAARATARTEKADLPPPGAGGHSSENSRRVSEASTEGVAEPVQLEPGIDYPLEACSGQWAYMNDEGSSYIQKGYRIGLDMKSCIKSMFQIHNETVNVWSHLCGFFLFIFLCLYVLYCPSLHIGSSGSSSNLPGLLPVFNARRPVPECLPEDDRFMASLANATNSSSDVPVCRKADEMHAWTVSHMHFEAAKDILHHVKQKLPGIEHWKDVLESKTRGMQENVAAEARVLQRKLEKAVKMLDGSVQSIKEELAYISSASMEGCIGCWADMVKNLARSQDSLKEQLASVSKMSRSAMQGGHGWGMSTAEWADYTALEMSSLAHSLRTGIAATKKALKHASNNLHDELLHELLELRELDLFPMQDPKHYLERWPIVVFLLSACTCLLTSASYHLFNCHSRSLNDVLLLLDYVGISILIAGSFYPPIYYGFYCDNMWRILYLGAVTLFSVLSSVIGVYSGLNPSKFWRLARVLCYSANACFGVLPVMHLAGKYLAGEPSWPPAVAYITVMLGIYGLGTVIYTFQFPERYFPGKFDYFLSSHQLWHLLVFCAAFLHYFCAVGHYGWRSHSTCPTQTDHSLRF